MTTRQRGSAAIEFPNDLEILISREFAAPIELVFDVFTKPEHVRKHFAPFEEEVTVCSIDLRVGGDYHIVMVTKDGIECSFRGTYLEVERPTRTVETWIFDGWPGTEAVETVDLQAVDGMTKMTYRLVFPDKAGRNHMEKYDGLLSSFNNVEDYLMSLVDQTGGVSA
ncbi:MAG TPA: SRPBCC domain-containing protein [Candidatus Dormibacteraeota bacterium]